MSVRFNFIRAPKSIDKRMIKTIVSLFCYLYKIEIGKYTINIDFRKSSPRVKNPGPFGGFNDLLDKKNKQIYVDIRNFIEYKHGNTNSTIHCVLHEMVHVSDLLGNRMVVNKKGDELTYNKKLHTRCPFSFDIFQRIYALDKKLAQDLSCCEQNLVGNRKQNHF